MNKERDVKDYPIFGAHKSNKERQSVLRVKSDEIYDMLSSIEDVKDLSIWINIFSDTQPNLTISINDTGESKIDSVSSDLTSANRIVASFKQGDTTYYLSCYFDAIRDMLIFTRLSSVRGEKEDIRDYETSYTLEEILIKHKLLKQNY